MYKPFLKHWRGLQGTSLILSVLFVLSISTTNAQDGEALFKKNCSSCHTTTSAKLVGPGLKGASERWPDKQKLYDWVHDPPAYAKTGDAYINELIAEYNGVMMQSFPNLSNEEIDAIMAYVDAPPAEAVTDINVPGGTAPVQEEEDFSFTLLISLAVLFIILIAVLGGVGRAMQNLINEKRGLPPVPHRGFGGSIGHFINKNKRFTTVLIIIATVLLLKGAWDYMMGIGVYTGYAPEQPIAFSHKVHAGENGINCVYCHSSAEKSRHAGIPSANVCMNCHKGVTTGTRTGTDEISKIYAAVGYDPERADYVQGVGESPIAWIKVHNLPDHVYFNHSQHVTVGGIECQTCHGEVENMDVVEQFAPLTMGWCVDCHRTTGVKSMGNGYYDEFHRRFTEDPVAMETYMRSGKIDVDDGKLTVEEIGGLECAKCHY